MNRPTSDLSIVHGIISDFNFCQLCSCSQKIFIIALLVVLCLAGETSKLIDKVFECDMAEEIAAL